MAKKKKTHPVPPTRPRARAKQREAQAAARKRQAEGPRRRNSAKSIRKKARPTRNPRKALMERRRLAPTGIQGQRAQRL